MESLGYILMYFVTGIVIDVVISYFHFRISDRGRVDIFIFNNLKLTRLISLDVFFGYFFYRNFTMAGLASCNKTTKI